MTVEKSLALEIFRFLTQFADGNRCTNPDDVRRVRDQLAERIEEQRRFDNWESPGSR